MKKTLLFLFIALLNLSAHATHIIGGVLTYEFKPTAQTLNNYEVTMKIYRDCNSSTPFDGQSTPGFPSFNPARISIFEQGTNILIDTLELWNPVVTVVQPPINSPCLNITTNVCVEEGVYIFEYNFPDFTKGYYVTYERCCRNGTISNLLNPGSQGATYSVDIPPTILFQNNNPVFNQFPPIFICANSPLIFNHSATDIDGDSLVYSLCEPLNGASQAFPAPVASSKPYFPVNWFGPFNAQDPLGGNPLSIDPVTGILTGTPTALGQFVVGICVEEYRNGVLLSTTLRDFQFNVTTCNFPVAGIPGVTNIDPVSGIGDYKIDCQDLTVDFLNGSVGATEFFWDFGDPSTSADTSNLVNPTYTYQDTGEYLVMLIASNTLQCNDTIKVKVKLFPVFDTDFEYRPVCADSAVQFIDSSMGSYGTVNKWKWSFGDGVGSSNVQDPSYQYASGGLYNVSLISETTKGCKDTLTRQVTVYPIPNANFSNVSACVLDTIQFNQTSSGNINFSNWNFGDNTPISTMANPAHVYQQAGNYSVTLNIISAKGCKDTIAKSIQVFPRPVVDVSNDTSICPATSVSLSANGGNTYVWSPASVFNNPGLQNPVASPQAPQTVFVAVTDVNGCSSTDSLFIDFYDPPQIDAGKDTSVCLEPNSFRDSVTLNASGGVTYQWSPTAGLDDPSVFNPTSRPPFNTTYFVTAVDTNGCTGTDSVNVFYLDPKLDLITILDTAICALDTINVPVIDLGLITEYTWSPVNGLSDPDIRKPEFFPLNTTLYILTISNYCYFKDDSVVINVNQLPQVNTGKLDSICIGDTIQLNAEGGATYSWSFDPTLSATNIPDPLAWPASDNKYFVSVTDSIGCTNNDSIEILVFLPPVTDAWVNEDRPFICYGQSVFLSASGGVSYLWDDDATLMFNDSVNALVTPLDTSEYFVTVTNQQGCTARDSVIVNIQERLDIRADSLLLVCEGGSEKLKASGGFYYNWQPTDYLNYTNIADPVTTPLSDVTYLVEISNDCFLDSVYVEVDVKELPTAEAGPDQSTVRGIPVQLDGSGGTEYFWLPVDGLQDPTLENTFAEPFESITYTLRVTDEFGCISYDSVRISVSVIDNLSIPSGFSPNNDGTNDRFGILQASNLDEIFEFSVYNRWGEKIFFTTDVRESWDGTYKGQPMEMGTYTYHVDYLTLDGERFQKSGTVTLLR